MKTEDWQLLTVLCIPFNIVVTCASFALCEKLKISDWFAAVPYLIICFIMIYCYQNAKM